LQPDTTAIRSVLSGAGIDAEVTSNKLGVMCTLAAADVRSALAALKASDHAFTMMVDLFGMDTGEGIQVTYFIRSLARDEEVRLRSEIPYGGTLSSVWDVFLGALMPERECAELFGLRLADHPNPSRLLTTDATPPLLLKSTLIRTAEEVRDR